MSFNSNYLKLRAEREAGSDKTATGNTPATNSDGQNTGAGNDSFTRNYLELRRGRGGTITPEQTTANTQKKRRSQWGIDTEVDDVIHAAVEKAAVAQRASKTAARAQTASGLLAEDVERAKQQREVYQKQLNVAQADLATSQEPLDTRGLLPEEAEGMRALRQAQASAQGAYLPSAPDSETVRDLKEKIAALDEQLMLYDRVDKLYNERIAPLKDQEGFDTAKETYVASRRAGSAEKAQQELEESYERMKELTWNRSPEQFRSDPEWDALSDRINELEAQVTGYEEDSEFDDYMRWWSGLSEETQNKYLNHEYSQKDFERDSLREDEEDLDTDIWDIPSGYQHHWERMTDDEVNAYYYIANTEGMAAAQEFLEDLQLTLDRRYTLTREQAEQEKMGNLSAGGAAVMGALTVGENLIGAPVSFASNVADKLAGKEFNPYSNGNALLGQSGNIRSAASANFQSAISGDGSDPFLNAMGEVTANVYQAALSTLDSMAGMVTMGSAYTVSMGMGAASTRMRELYESGASDKEIYMGAIGSGVLEAVFEKVSLDKFADKFIRENPEKWVKKMLLQAGVEGSEEILTELSNMLLDAANRGLNSDHSRRVRELMNDPDDPMTREEAESKAACEDAMDVFWAGFGGVVSGGLSSVGGAVIEQSRRNATGKYLDSQNFTENDIQDLVNEGLDTEEGTVAHRLASEMQKKLDRGEAISGYDMGLLWGQLREIQPDASWDRSTNAQMEDGSATEEGADGGDRSRALTLDTRSATLQEEIERQMGGDIQEQATDVDQPGTLQEAIERQMGGEHYKEIIAAATGNNTVQNENEPLSVAQRLRENQNNGGNNYGTETGLRLGEAFERSGNGVSDGSGERYAGTGTGEQAGQLAKSAIQRARSRVRAVQAEDHRRSLAKNLRFPTVSSIELGIKSGTDVRSVQEIPEQYWDEDLANTAQRIHEETGKNVRYVIGKIQVRGIGKKVLTVRGVNTGNEIIVQADNLNITAGQIADHEAYHTKVKGFRKGNLNETLREYIIEKFSEEELNKVLGKYIDGLDGSLFNVKNALDGDAYERAVEQVLEELLADAYAGINAFGFGADRFTEAVNERMDQLDMGKLRQQDNGTRQTDGPPVERYSIDDVDGERNAYESCVRLDTDLFDGVRPRDWGKVLGDYVYHHMAGAELTVYMENGQPEIIHLAKTTDRVQKDGARNSHRVIDKLARYRGDNIGALATVHLSELLKTSKYKNSTDEHSHQWMDEQGWEHRTTFLADRSGNIYTAELNIAKGRDRNILYAINNIRQIDKERATHGAVPSTENGRGSHIKSSSLNESIAEQGRNVKEKYSYAGSLDEEIPGLQLPTLEDIDADNDAEFDAEAMRLRLGAAFEDDISEYDDRAVERVESGIYPDMDDENRAEKLRQKEIRVPAYDSSNPVNGAQIMKLKGMYTSKASELLRTLARQCGAISRKYYNADADIEFKYSMRSVRESINKQATRGGGAEDFGKMLTVLPEICEGAVEIEAHTDKYVGTKRMDSRLKEVHVLVGAFSDSGTVTPVQLEIKEYKPRTGIDDKLYVTITLKNEAGISSRGNAASSASTSTHNTPASVINVADLVADVKDDSGGFVKYFPDAMLSTEQMRAKNNALAKENERLGDMRYEYAVEQGETETAEQMLRQRAGEKGYSTDDDWRMRHRAPNASDGISVCITNAGMVYGGDESIYLPAAARYYGEGRTYDGEALRVFTQARGNPDAMITVYRAVPNHVSDTRLRNGDWVTQTSEYAREHGEAELDGDYRIVSQKVPAKYLYVNGDSIHELGYDNGRTDEVYKNTANNVKLSSATYDDAGNLIPLSRRFDETNADIRYSVDDESHAIWEAVDDETWKLSYNSDYYDRVLAEQGTVQRNQREKWLKEQFSGDEQEYQRFLEYKKDREFADKRAKLEKRKKELAESKAEVDRQLKETEEYKTFNQLKEKKKKIPKPMDDTKFQQVQEKINDLMKEYQQAAAERDQKAMDEISDKLKRALKEASPKERSAPAKKPRPVAKSQAIESKRELRSDVLSLFSVPEGQKAELGGVIDSYAERLLKNGSLTEEDRQAFFDRMYESGVMTVPADEYYAMGREYLVNGRVYVSDSVVTELGDDWNELRRRAFNAGVYLTRSRETNGHRNAGIDTWNADLASDLPGLFDENETDQRSILERIVQVAEEGKDERMSLPEYTAWLAGQEHVPESEFLDGMERKLDEALRTFAKEAALEIKLKDRTGVKIAQERERFGAHNANYEARQALREERRKLERQEAAVRAREKKELQELQQKTLKQLQWLNKNQNRAPEELRAQFEEVLGDIDLYAVGAANEMRWSDKHNATWKDLARMYKDAQKSDPNFLPSKELERIVARLDSDKIGEMDIGALQDLYKAAIGLRTEFYNRNNVVNDEMHRLFSEVYTDAKNEIESAPGGYSGKTLDKIMNLEQLTPMNVMQRMGGWDPNGTFYSMAKQLETGERDMRAYTVKAKRMLQEFLEEHEDFVKKADGQGKDAVWYGIEVPELMELNMGDKPIFGPTVKVWMTPSQKVHMYLESKNYDNLRHMTGGRTFANKELYSQGKRQEAFAQGRTIRLAPETVRSLVSDLTAEEMELARLLEQYYNTFATKEINRVSNVLYGYDKAMGKNYAPIYTNKNYTKAEFGVFDSTAEGVGNLKGRQYSTNPSYNIGAFDAFERHIDQTARFVGMAIPARNWTTLMNWRTANSSTGDVITHKWGEESKNYITDLITGLQNGEGVKTDTVSSGIEKLQSNYISAVFGANPSIVLKQLGSIPLASVYLGGKNVPSPKQIWHIDRNLISKYTQDLEWRTMGYSMPETKFLKDNPNWTETNKFFSFTFGGGAITAMDGWAASVLWPWAENKVRREFPELEVGTKAQIENGESPFYKKVAEEFNDAVARSQSTSDEIHQGTLRKSKNPFTKVFTMFRSDSAQTYNAIRQKIGEAQYYVRSGKSKEAAQMAKRAAGNAVVSMIAGYVWAEAIELLMNLWKYKGKRYRDDEGELTAESVMGEMASGLVGDIAGVVVGGDELYDAIGSIVTGDKWYGIDTLGVEQLNELVETLIDAGSGMRDLVADGADILKNDGDLGEYFRKHSGDILGNVKELAQAAATYLPGLPVNNLEAYLLGTVKWVSPELGTAYDDLFADISKDNLSGMTGGSLETRIEHILEDRKISESDETARALSELYEAGLKGAVPSDTPKSISVDGEERTLSTYQKQVYDTAWSEAVSAGLDELIGSERFESAEAATQEKMIKKLYSYAAEQAKAAVFEDYKVETSVLKNEDIIAAGGSIALCAAWDASVKDMKSAQKAQLLKDWELSDQVKKAIFRNKISDSREETISEIESTGVSFDRFLNAYSAYSEINSLDLDANRKALKFALWVSSQGYEDGQAKVIRDELAFYNMATASAKNFEELTESGMEAEDAYDLSEELGNLQAEEGVSVSHIQRWRASVDFSDDVEKQLISLSVTMTDKQFQKVEIANDFGVKPDSYVKFYEVRDRYDENGNGSFNQAEVKAVIDGEFADLNTKQKAVLWQLMNSSTSSAKNNPYSRDVGQQVLDAKTSAKAAAEEEGTMGNFSDEVNRQILNKW